MNDTKIDSMFRAGDYEGASNQLKEGFEKETLEGKDGLLYLLDLGLSLHTAGKYEESTKYFRMADQAVEIKDYTSLSTEAATLLASDTIKQYKGEDFENVLISAYLAMDYALEGKREDAIVEAKRVNRKLYMMTTEGKRNYKQNAFARYLSATLYEADRNWNDANVDYKFAADLLPTLPMIGRDLWAMAWKLKNRDDLATLEEKYHLTEADKNAAKKRVSPDRPAEIVVLFQNGISPKKIPEPNFPSVPRFVPRGNPVTGGEAIVSAAGNGEEIGRGKTASLMDIESVAIQNLKEKWGGLLAKKIGGAVVKHTIGNIIDSKTGNSGLGSLVALALYAADQADTRSWNLLPKSLEITRIPVTAGTYTVALHPIGAGALPPKTVQVKSGEKIFVNFRYMP